LLLCFVIVVVDVQIGSQARLMSLALRKIASHASKCGCTIIFINQLRNKVRPRCVQGSDNHEHAIDVWKALVDVFSSWQGVGMPLAGCMHVEVGWGRCLGWF
jgi:hypothetical protein